MGGGGCAEGYQRGWTVRSQLRGQFISCGPVCVRADFVDCLLRLGLLCALMTGTALGRLCFLRNCTPSRPRQFFTESLECSVRYILTCNIAFWETRSQVSDAGPRTPNTSILFYRARASFYAHLFSSLSSLLEAVGSFSGHMHQSESKYMPCGFLWINNFLL